VTGNEPRLWRAGFEVVEERQPSFLFDRSVLVTGEVARTTQGSGVFRECPLLS